MGRITGSNRSSPRHSATEGAISAPPWVGHRHRRWQRRPRGPLRRDVDDRIVAGVAAGLSRRIGVDPTIVRIVFVVAALSSGFGLVGYVLAWLTVPSATQSTSIASRAARDRRGLAMVIAFVPALAAVLLLLSALGFTALTSATWALCASGAGLVLVYRNADDKERAWLKEVASPLLAGGRRSRSVRAARLVIGLTSLGVGLWLLVHGHSTTAALRPLSGAVLVLVAVVVILGPWWLRLGRQLVEERRARVRAEERADMAARVHDSVLQTLALIQRSAADSARVAQLARAQERDLRAWLFDGAVRGRDQADSLAGAIDGMARESEATYPVTVETVTVGDCTLDEHLAALVAAAGEAVTNAAKWSGAPEISVFCEVGGQEVSLYVRDRGRGFDRANVPPDRRGLSGSIEERMRRHGGRATIRSVPGQGTEIELAMARRQTARREPVR